MLIVSLSVCPKNVDVRQTGYGVWRDGGWISQMQGLIKSIRIVRKVRWNEKPIGSGAKGV